MLLDRLRDVDVLALRGRVVTPHQPLQFRELADHLGYEIGFAQLGGSRGQFRHAADRRRQRPRQRGDPLYPLALRAELLMKYDA